MYRSSQRRVRVEQAERLEQALVGGDQLGRVVLSKLDVR